MSAIAGILHDGGRPVDPVVLGAMIAAMSHRAVDGRECWTAGAAGLAHGEFNTAEFRANGPRIAADGPLSITADVRLDNREELVALLGGGAEGLSDAGLILHAYRRWGGACVERLLGDFAFVVFDADRQVMFGARDHVGVRPFYYQDGKVGFCFASEAKGVLASGLATDRINDTWLADFLAGTVTSMEATSYSGVRRLPPGHLLWRSAEGLRVQRYWRLEPGRTVAAKDAADAFAEMFGRAVRCRLDGALAPAAFLSGGLDSSAIAALAGKQRATSAPLPTLSVVFDETPQWCERPYAEAVAATANIDTMFLDGGDLAPFADFNVRLQEQDGLLLAPGAALSRFMYREAAEAGHRVMLDGHGGDEVVSHGVGHLHALARSQNWLGVAREARGVADLFGQSAIQTCLASYERYGPGGRFLRSARRRVTGDGRQTSDGVATIGAPMINPEFARHAGLGDRIRSPNQSSWTETDWHLEQVRSPLQPYALEGIGRTAAASGVEARFPFWDRRLVELCVSLPGKAKLNKGWSRHVLREAMDGMLPDKVRLRRDKLDFTPHLARGLARHHRALMQDVLIDHASDIEPYIVAPVITAAHHRLMANPDSAHGADVQTVWRATAFALWLRSRQQPARAIPYLRGGSVLDAGVTKIVAGAGT